MTNEAYDDLVVRLQARVGLTLKSKWRIDRLLGVGGMASVYAATHRNNKRVAVKMLHPELSMNAAIRQRFLREGYVANSVGHPGAVIVDDDDVTDDDCAFLVMELLEGETLDARWERKGRRLEPTEVLALIDPVLDTLAVAHEKGIVHRDLKPENLFLTHGSQVKVLDFGIARVKELSAGGSHTQTGSLMGTPTFMPPEQARGHWDEVDRFSDIWAIGATMFTLLTGRHVHLSTNVSEALVLAVTQRAPSVGAVGVALPREVVELVDRALAYDKDQRWPDARAMQESLRHAYATLPHKPISLLDAIEDDERRDVRGAAGVSSAAIEVQRTPTTAGGVAASKPPFNGAHWGSPRIRSRLATVVGAAALVSGLAIANGVRRRVSLSQPPEPSSDGAAPSTLAAASGHPPTSSIGSAPDSALVVRLDHLPLAPAGPPVQLRDTRRKAGELARPAAALPLTSAVASAGALPVPPKPAATPASAPSVARSLDSPRDLGDPWAARH